MKSMSHVICGVALLFAGVCLAGDASNNLVSFSTPGPDKYADNATVLDGEWCALCWSPDGIFEGFTPTCGPIDANDCVVQVKQLAKDGKCPDVTFQIDANSDDYKTTGKYAIIMLDTRNCAKTEVAAAKNGKPALVNGALVLSVYKANEAAAPVAGVEEIPCVGETPVWAASDFAQGTDPVQPKITAFEIQDVNIVITVDDMIYGIKYNVVAGSSPQNLEAYALDVPVMSDGKATFKINCGSLKFFQVVRQPLDK